VLGWAGVPLLTYTSRKDGQANLASRHTATCLALLTHIIQRKLRVHFASKRARARMGLRLDGICYGARQAPRAQAHLPVIQPPFLAVTATSSDDICCLAGHRYRMGSIQAAFRHDTTRAQRRKLRAYRDMNFHGRHGHLRVTISALWAVASAIASGDMRQGKACLIGGNTSFVACFISRTAPF